MWEIMFLRGFSWIRSQVYWWRPVLILSSLLKLLSIIHKRMVTYCLHLSFPRIPLEMILSVLHFSCPIQHHPDRGHRYRRRPHLLAGGAVTSSFIMRVTSLSRTTVSRAQPLDRFIRVVSWRIAVKKPYNEERYGNRETWIKWNPNPSQMR